MKKTPFHLILFWCLWNCLTNQFVCQNECHNQNWWSNSSNTRECASEAPKGVRPWENLHFWSFLVYLFPGAYTRCRAIVIEWRLSQMLNFWRVIHVILRNVGQKNRKSRISELSFQTYIVASAWSRWLRCSLVWGDMTKNGRDIQVILFGSEWCETRAQPQGSLLLQSAVSISGNITKLGCEVV